MVFHQILQVIKIMVDGGDFSDPWYIPTGYQVDVTINNEIALNGTNPVLNKKLDYKTMNTDPLVIIVHNVDPIINGSPVLDTTLSVYYVGFSGGTETFFWETSNATKIKLANVVGQKEGTQKTASFTSSKQIEISVPNNTIESMKDICRTFHQSQPEFGLSGTFETFVTPYICKGDLLICNFNARAENIIGDLTYNHNDYTLFIAYDYRLSTNQEYGWFVAEIGDPFSYNKNNDYNPIIDSSVTDYQGIPFDLYLADEVNTSYDNKNSIRQEIKIHKIPSSYLSKQQILNGWNDNWINKPANTVEPKPNF